MIRLKVDAAICSFCCGPVRVSGENLECTQCGHEMPIDGFPRSDRALHRAVKQAKEFQRECDQ